jgi:hypothetical protein
MSALPGRIYPSTQLAKTLIKFCPVVLEIDQLSGADINNFSDNNYARDIILEMEVDNLSDQGPDAHFVKRVKEMSQESAEVFKNTARAI